MVFCAKSFLLFALIVTILIPNSLQIDVRCEYQISHGWKLIENPDNDPYGCFIKNTLNVNGKTSITSATGQHNNGYDDSSVVALNIYEGTCEVIPSGFSSVFPNVEYFSVWSAKLKSVSSADIQQFSKLREIWLYSNNLEYLESNLFEFNPNVQYINFNSNKIKYIGGNFFTNLPNLQKANFRDNPCTSSEANDGAALEAIKREIRQQCPINGAGERIGDGAKTIGWDDFVLVFNKTYADNSAKAYRQQIFLQNQQIIRTHNSLYDQGGSTYSLAFNIFGDWTFTEYLSIMGFFPSQQSKDDFAAAALYDLSNVPAGDLRGKRSTTPETKDWRIDGAVTPIKNQQSCQSCWAFSAVGALEGLFFRKNGRLTSFSEQQLVDCSKKNHGCNKGYTNSAFLYTRCQGIVTDDTYPYIAKEKQCAVTEGLFKNVAYKSVLPNGDEDMLKDIVGNVGPVSAGMDFTNQNSMLFHDGVYLDDGCLSDLGSINHAILVIGYGHDSAKNMDYWLIKNSFGTTWGEGGYGKVARNKGNHCAIASAANYPVA
ncbi:digestive cysteine proteinase 3-like [Bradysia coprophila]|uniref:digestive cysteine proteinase 3-like n=1 Tax=Bradysia coprophila TaxID=38358 RepID=UPI00187D90B7|nr:digestive cysteine proteinase 3-like [Bradysia coprophila]